MLEVLKVLEVMGVLKYGGYRYFVFLSFVSFCHWWRRLAPPGQAFVEDEHGCTFFSVTTSGQVIPICKPSLQKHMCTPRVPPKEYFAAYWFIFFGGGEQGWGWG